ncbi:bifunctional adenosylcobinamide kinase/adenosylcobinamide-phosphate guanylyltransferase [Eubacterium ruminantium]|uniref:bifunctional adenosylcobinamide kinase/adenosylcobinamide-phosphate guanylyltransferase n=1 Tax=Eubacterium ruminantium TaxID=42322 RepID=UPI0015689D46|nr:bifunctional adenosylcobinamide kinase/adenosylcobinamide-phosphate guanylyltransferase [Eubacterium ruminantium]
MELYIGGHAAGKWQLVSKKYEDQISEGKCRVINKFHIEVREKLCKLCEEKGGTAELNKVMSVDEIVDIIWNDIFGKCDISGEDGLLIISDDIGCGLVPMDPFDRLWRDVNGKILIRIASKAKNVYRIICGIEQKIK